MGLVERPFKAAMPVFLRAFFVGLGSGLESKKIARGRVAQVDRASAF